MNFIRRIIRPNSLIVRKGKYILLFLNGFLLASLFYLQIEKRYEKNLFAAMAAYVQSSVTSNASLTSTAIDDSLLVKSNHLVHALSESRLAVFEKNPVNGIKADIIHPASVDLMTAQGACGSYAYVLARLLQEMNKEVRIPQMSVEGQSAGHIIVEVKSANGWVVLDPLSDVYFRKPDGHLAAFNDVKTDWTYYQRQLPSGYNMNYRYEGVRYTNWDKIPLVMPLIKNVMYWTMGKEKTDGYSIRSLWLKKYNVLFNITLGVYLLVCLFTINLFVKAQRRKANELRSISVVNATLPVQPTT